jgi:hypothetical protein
MGDLSITEEDLDFLDDYFSDEISNEGKIHEVFEKYMKGLQTALRSTNDPDESQTISEQFVKKFNQLQLCHEQHSRTGTYFEYRGDNEIYKDIYDDLLIEYYPILETYYRNLTDEINSIDYDSLKYFEYDGDNERDFLEKQAIVEHVANQLKSIIDAKEKLGDMHLFHEKDNFDFEYFRELQEKVDGIFGHNLDEWWNKRINDSSSEGGPDRTSAAYNEWVDDRQEREEWDDEELQDNLEFIDREWDQYREENEEKGKHHPFDRRNCFQGYSRRELLKKTKNELRDLMDDAGLEKINPPTKNLMKEYLCAIEKNKRCDVTKQDWCKEGQTCDMTEKEGVCISPQTEYAMSKKNEIIKWHYNPTWGALHTIITNSQVRMDDIVNAFVQGKEFVIIPSDLEDYSQEHLIEMASSLGIETYENTPLSKLDVDTLSDAIVRRRNTKIDMAAAAPADRTKGNWEDKQNISFLEHLERHHGNVCVITGDGDKLPRLWWRQTECGSKEGKLSSLHCDDYGDDSPATFLRLVGDVVKSCKRQGKRFVIFPYSLTGYKNRGTDPVGHRNFYVYDLILKSLERFEPHGVNKSCFRFSDIDDKVEEAIRGTLGSQFVMTYYRPEQYCPEDNKYEQLGFQAYEGINRTKEVRYTDPEDPNRDPRGFCQSWAMWYADLRLSNPDINRGALIEEALEYLKNKKNFVRFIRNYSSFGFELSEKCD